MRFPGNFGYGIARQDHPIIVFDPAANRSGHANASGHTRDDTGVDVQIAEDRIEGGAWRKAAKAFLDDQMLAVSRLQLVNDLRSPGSLDDEGAVAARWANSNAPYGNAASE